MNEPKPFIPAANLRFLTPFYETLFRPFNGRIWRKVVEETAKRAPPNGHVVDLGCGPGTVLRMLRKRRPDLRLTGTDIDPAILRIAERKGAGRGIAFALAPIDRQPLPDAGADLVLSSLVFHHLPTEAKRGAFREARRILKPGGNFLLCDFTSPLRPWLLTGALWQYIEPDVIPQLRGQLLTLAREEGATAETLWMVYGCIGMVRCAFPA